MLQVDAQPPSPPTAVQALLAQDAYMLAASENVSLTVSRQSQTEAAVVRYYVYAKADVRAEAAPASGAGSILCKWTITAHIQRDYCIRSITSRYACSESTIRPLPDTESGYVTLDGDRVAACELSLPVIADARLRFAAALATGKSQRINDDLVETLMPELRVGGFTMRRR